MRRLLSVAATSSRAARRVLSGEGRSPAPERHRPVMPSTTGPAAPDWSTVSKAPGISRARRMTPGRGLPGLRSARVRARRVERLRHGLGWVWARPGRAGSDRCPHVGRLLPGRCNAMAVERPGDCPDAGALLSGPARRKPAAVTGAGRSPAAARAGPAPGGSLLPGRFHAAGGLAEKRRVRFGGGWRQTVGEGVNVAGERDMSRQTWVLLSMVLAGLLVVACPKESPEPGPGPTISTCSGSTSGRT